MPRHAEKIFVGLRKGTRLYGFVSDGLPIADPETLDQILTPWVRRKSC